MNIAIVGMLDEREEGLGIIKDYVEHHGHKAILMDISIGTGTAGVSLKPDIGCDELAEAGGISIEKLRGMLANEREKATAAMAEGLGKKLVEMHLQGDMHGVISVGGMTGTFISITAMKRLPFGFPKVLISSVAALPAYSKKFADYFGVSDITVMHSVVDTVGLNPLVRNLMRNGAGAICGMVDAREPSQKGQKLSLAITEFGFCDKGAHHVRDALEEDYNIISFHATGLGEKAAVDLVRQGLFEAFIDLVPAGFSEYLLGGNRAAGPDRLDVGKNLDIPYIISPCGFDMLSCGPVQRRDEGDPLWVSRKISERKLLVQDAMRVQARTTEEEMKTIAKEVAAKLNAYKNKKRIKFVIPKKGFSSLSVENGALHDPASDNAFLESLRKELDPDIEIIEVNTHINTSEFARAVINSLKQAKVKLDT